MDPKLVVLLVGFLAGVSVGMLLCMLKRSRDIQRAFSEQAILNTELNQLQTTLAQLTQDLSELKSAKESTP